MLERAHWWMVSAVLLGIGFLGWAKQAKAQTKGTTVPLTLLFTPDLGGHLQGFRCQKSSKGKVRKSPTMAHLLHRIQQVRRELKAAGQLQPLLFNTGDFLGPRQDVRYLMSQPKGEGARTLARFFKAMDFDLIGIGNHEFSVPLQQLDTFLQKSRRNGLQFSASNIVKTKALHPLHIVINRDLQQRKRSYFVFETQPHQGKRLRIAVFHLLPPSMPVSPKRLMGLTIAPPIEHARKVVASIKKMNPPADLTVVMSHLGHSYDPNKQLKKLARDVPGIDLILTNGMRDSSSHSKTIIYTNKSGNHVYLFGGSKYGRMLHRIDVRMSKHNSSTKATLLSVRPKTLSMNLNAENQKWKGVFQRWEDRYCEQWGRQLGKGRIPTGKKMTYQNFLRYSLNVIRYASKSEMAVINEGAIRRKPFPLKHHITADDLYRALPFNAKLIRVTLTGRELLKWFLPKTGSLEGLDEEMEYAGWTPKGKKINGRPVELDKVYQFVTIEYVVSLRRAQMVKQIARLRSRKKQTLVQKRKLRFLLQRLKQFDTKWKVITYPTCRLRVKLSDNCPSSCCPKLRTLLHNHFEKNEFEQWTQQRLRSNPSLNTVASEQSTSTIPYEGSFLNLHERFAWSLDTEIALSFDSNFITPMDLVGARSYPRIPTDFFTQYQFSGTLNVAFRAGTKSHQWDTNFLLHYGAYIRSQAVIREQGNLGFNEIFDEVNDQVILNSMYRFQRIKRFRPLVRVEMQTELTRRGRPNLSDTAYIEALNQIRYRSFSLEGEFGFEVNAVPKHLVLGLSLSAKKQFALEQFPNPGSPIFQTNPGLGGLPDTNFLPGLVVQYRTSQLKLFSIGQRAMTFQSLGRYILRVSVPVDVEGATVLPSHEIELDNILAFSINRYLSLALQFKAIFYQGTLQKENADSRVRVPGPWAFWLTPSAMLRIKWGTRGQSI